MSSASDHNLPSRRWATIAAALAFAAGIAARITGAWWLRHAKNPDYAVVVQMARHMAEGRGWPVFFYGQPYMGSLEPTVSGALVALFGPAPFTVCLGTALFGIALLWAVHRWARECGGPWAGTLAVATAAVGPVGYFQYMASPRGGYALGLLLSILVLREGAGLAWAARRTRTVEPGRVLLFGLLAGLGFWNFWLTLPAIAAAGCLVWAGGLRGRVPPWRTCLTGIAGFAAGSAPFWIWNASHNWGSFTSQQSTVGLRAFLDNLRLLLVERLPMLLDLHGATTGKRLALLGMHGVLVAGAAMACRPRRKTPWSFATWSLAGMVLYTALFVVAYGASSFGSIRSPRYLLPFVPLFAVLAGTGVARAADWARRGFGRARLFRLSFAALAIACWVAILAPQARKVRSFQTAETWPARATAVADELVRRGADAAVADYMLYGFNWATRERLCFSSPSLERYTPFAHVLERAEQPAVVENFHGFDHFLAATGATADGTPVASYRVHSGAAAPAMARNPLPVESLKRISDDRGNDWTRALTDLFRSTLASMVPNPEGECFLEIQFSEPQAVGGVRAWVHEDDGFATWSVEGRTANGEPYTPLSPPQALTGYFWSGPRFYFGGMAWREEKRFEPATVVALRISFRSRGDRRVARLSELQILQDAGKQPPLNVPAIAAALRSRKVVRVHADRWLANQLHDALDGSVWTSREPSVFGESPEGSPIRLNAGTALAVEPGVEASARQALGRLGITAEEVAVGGVRLFLLPNVEGPLSAYRGLRFQGLLVLHEHPQALAQTDDRIPCTGELPLDAEFLKGRLKLVGLSAWPSEARPGEVFAFQAEWRVDDGFMPPAKLGFFVHFLRDSTIVFQMDDPKTFHTVDGGTIAGKAFTTFHAVRIPPTVAPGPVVPVLGLCRYNLLARRLPAKTDQPTLNHRIVVPGSFKVLP